MEEYIQGFSKMLLTLHTTAKLGTTSIYLHSHTHIYNYIYIHIHNVYIYLYDIVILLNIEI